MTCRGHWKHIKSQQEKSIRPHTGVDSTVSWHPHLKPQFSRHCCQFLPKFRVSTVLMTCIQSVVIWWVPLYSWKKVGKGRLSMKLKCFQIEWMWTNCFTLMFFYTWPMSIVGPASSRKVSVAPRGIGILTLFRDLKILQRSMPSLKTQDVKSQRHRPASSNITPPFFQAVDPGKSGKSQVSTHSCSTKLANCALLLLLG